MTARRPSSRAVEAYRKILAAGLPTVAQWRRYSLRVKVAAIYRLTHGGRDARVQDLPGSGAKEWDGKA